ncbi:hypothetical protein HMPREF1320_0761 [Capnocytophaga sp. oral taxon 335 str. F0486]|nr:hypothetical protein HMPREF1320_0761 [Capnocytophaga sp. oral taxon 335 str. F0486]
MKTLIIVTHPHIEELLPSLWCELAAVPPLSYLFNNSNYYHK